MADVFFTEVEAALRTPQRQQVLNAGIETAKSRRGKLFQAIVAKRAPAVVRIAAKYNSDAGLGEPDSGSPVEVNPLRLGKNWGLFPGFDVRFVCDESHIQDWREP